MEQDASYRASMPQKAVSSYRLIRYHLQTLAADIEAEDWSKAGKDLQSLEQAVSMEISPTGQDAGDLHELFFNAQYQIENPSGLLGYNPYIQKEVCREEVSKIVNKLTEYGIYLGQKIKVDGQSQDELLHTLRYFNGHINTLAVRFVEEDMGKEQMLGALRQLQHTVSQYRVDGQDMTTLKRHLLHSINDTLGEMNAVNLEQPGKLTFQNFARSAASLQHALNAFLLAREDPIYRRQVLEEMQERGKGEKEGEEREYNTAFEENMELREALKALIDEVLDERESGSIP